MSKRVRLRPEARADIRDARNWYTSKREGFGLVFARRAIAVLRMIEYSPELYGRVWRNVRAVKIRRHPYVIYNRVLATEVEVIAVMDGTRDASAWLSRV